MQSFIDSIYNSIQNPELVTFLVSMLPMLELKGGILFARGLGLDFFWSFFLAFLGSSFSSFLVYLLLIPIFRLLKKIKFVNKFVCRCEDYINEKAQSAVDKHKDKKWSVVKVEWFAVFIFVGIPLPLTGVWMGTAIAVFLNLKVKHGFTAVMAGNFVAGLIISIIAQLFLPYVDYILYGLFGIVVILSIIIIIKLVFTKGSKKEKEANVEGK